MDHLAEQIVARIAGDGLSHGARLPAERQLAAELGVSRSRLREALQHLISQGVLISRQGGGTYIAAPAPQSLLRQALAPLSALVVDEPGYWQDVMEIRQSLEGDMAYYAALRASPADHQRLSAALERMRLVAGAPNSGPTPNSGPNPDPQAQADADADFHLALAGAAQNAVLYHVMVGLRDLLHRSISASITKLYHLPATVAALGHQHQAIVAAIIAGEPEAARQAAHDHLAFVKDQLHRLETTAARSRRAALAVPSIFPPARGVSE